MRDESKAATIIVGAAIVSPIALLLAPVLLISVGWLQHEMLFRLAECVGLKPDKKRFAPFIWPLVSTLIFVVLATGVHVLFEDSGAGAIVGMVVGGGASLALITAPLTFYVPARLDQRASRPSIDSALKQWDAVPRRQKIALVCLRLAPILLASIVYLVLTRVWSFDSLELLAIAPAYVLGLGFYQWVALRAYQDTPAVSSAIGMTSTRWRLLLPAALASVAALPLTLFAAQALSLPAPMTLSTRPSERIYAGRNAYSVEASDLRVVPRRLGVDVMRGDIVLTHADYGLSCPTEERPEISIVAGSARGVHIYANACGGWHDFWVGPNGQRQEDGVFERLSGRMGLLTLLSLFLGLALLMLALVRLLPSMANARRIASVVRREDLESATQESIVEGTLRLEKPPHMKIQQKVLGVGHIEIVIDGDRFNLPLPDTVPCAKGEYNDGTTVSLIGVFSSVSRGHRDATIPWPKRAFLVSSTADEARETWLWETTSVARIAAIASTLSLVASYAFFAMHAMGY